MLPANTPAEHLQETLLSGDPERILAACAEYESTGPDEGPGSLLDHARRAAGLLGDLRRAVDEKSPLLAHQAYQELLRLGVLPGRAFDTSGLMDLVRLARTYQEFRKALGGTPQDLGDVVRLGRMLIALRPDLLSPVERLKVLVATRDLGALERMREALATEDDGKICGAFQSHLAHSYHRMDSGERHRLACALLNLTRCKSAAMSAPETQEASINSDT